MPPRKTVPASPATSNRRAQPEASPARSTRSNRRNEEDEWEGASVISQSSTYKVPSSRTGKNGAASSAFLSGTTVQIAAAFNSAMNGGHTDSGPRRQPAPRRANGHISSGSRSSNTALNESSTHSNRQLSPAAEHVSSSARALSPTKFFLRPNDEDSGDISQNTFSSLGMINGHGMDEDVDGSYNYSREEDFLRNNLQNNRLKSPALSVTSTSKGGRRRASIGDRKKLIGRDDDTYRPGRDDVIIDEDDSDGEGGEGVVRGGALNGRAQSRGKRGARGEGYLGSGLGLRQIPSKGRRSGGDLDDQEEDEGVGSSDDNHLEDDKGGYDRGHSPMRDITPARILKSVTPRIDRTSVPLSRKRQPSAARIIVTNLLHGVVISLRFVVDLIRSILEGLLLGPIRKVFGSSKNMVKHLKQNWWKWALGILSLSLILRLAERPWRHQGQYNVPDLPPSSMEELLSRLSSIEHAIASITSTNSAIESNRVEDTKKSQSVIHRIGEVESSLVNDRGRVEIIRVGSEKQYKELQGSFDSLKSEVKELAGRVTVTELDNKGHGTRIKKLEGMTEEVEKLKERVGKVEREVESVLNDGRLRSVLEKILPGWMPVRKNKGGTVDIDPIFWEEMRKVLVGKGEVEGMIKNAMIHYQPKESGKNEKKTTQEKVMVWDEEKLDNWANKLYERQSARGDIISRSDFLRILEGEVTNLKETMEEIKSKVKSVPKNQPGSNVIKSQKGDDLTSALQALVDAALLRYSKDTIARPDYALFTAGGRVVPSITSDTLVMSSPGTFGRTILGKKPVEGLSPAHALMPDITVGKCWPFKGDVGQLGVMMSRRIVLSDLTVEHASLDVAVDIRSAPKDIEVWGLVEGQDNLEKAKEYLRTHPSADASMPPSPDYLRLASFTYDPSLPNHIQTFSVEPSIQALGIEMGIVVFKIQNNWGGDFTCLYRVRAHGEVIPNL